MLPLRINKLGLWVLSAAMLIMWPMQTMAADSVRILVVHAYTQEYPWTKGQHQGFVDGLTQKLAIPPTIKTEYLDTKRIDFDQDYADRFSAFLWDKYRDFHPDALYVTDDNGLSFGLANLSGLFPGTPLFFSGVNDYSMHSRLDKSSVTGVFEKKEIGPNLDLLQDLFGDVGHIIVVGDDSNTYQAIEREIQQEMAARQQMRITYVADNRLDVILGRLRQAERPVVLLTTLGAVQNNKGEILNLEQTITQIALSDTKVVISMEDAYLFDGVLGGYVTSGPAQGLTAASLLLSYLDGKPLTSIAPVTKSPNEYVIDDRVVQSLHLHLPARISSKAKILHPRVSFYRDHRYAILSVLVFLVLALVATLVLYTLATLHKNRRLRLQSNLLRQQGKKLQESEEKYRLLFELSEDPMLVIQDDLFVLANDAVGRVLGYDKLDSLRQVHPSRLSPERQPDGRLSLDKANEMMELAYTKSYHRFEWQHLKKDGQSLLIEVSLTRIPYEGKSALFCVWHDITDWRRAEQGLREKTVYLNGVLSASIKVGFVATDTDLNVTYYNQTAVQIFGLKPDELQGRDIHFFHGGEGGEADSRFIKALQQAREEGEFRFSLKRGIGNEIRYIDARISPIWDDGQTLNGYMLMAEDVTKQHADEELIKFQATNDILTSLPNRRTLVDRLSQTISRCLRHHQRGTLIFIDLDHFKHTNDTLGHTIGDTLLQQVAMRMQESVRSEDTVARLGGDEFVVLLSEIRDELESAVNDAQLIAGKLLHSIAESYVIEKHEIRISGSIGITIFPTGNESADDVLRQADTAMYQAKEAGRNTIKFFSPEMQHKVEARLRMLDELHQAVEKREFLVYFQPQIDSHGRLLGVESLVRWQRPDKSVVLPDQFIPLAEESGLIDPISEFVLRESLETQLRWADEYPDNRVPRISVNVSAMQFRQDSFVETIKRAVREIGNDPEVLTLELTESMLVGNISQTVEKMQQLKAYGIRFSIDDFGTGYSSLAYLKRLPISEIKIDRSFVQDILTDPNDSALVNTILSLAGQLQLEVVAEGVESEAIRNALIGYGCTIFQGYYFSRPIPAGQFEKAFLTN
ncbi:MAG: EAL domain-containing protein [Candidatus Thiodiazotropha sp. (ex Dulcina madagascariensis)]|nr:EAL domain-containing protein [Candidatus Thiodiazotropha sp. (ex Dulcina madagascariensis)]